MSHSCCSDNDWPVFLLSSEDDVLFFCRLMKESMLMLYPSLTRLISGHTLACHLYLKLSFTLLHLVGGKRIISFVHLSCLYTYQILQEEPDYPEALIGRGTAYAFQRELHAAIADFTKVITRE